MELPPATKRFITDFKAKKLQLDNQYHIRNQTNGYQYIMHFHIDPKITFQD